MRDFGSKFTGFTFTGVESAMGRLVVSTAGRDGGRVFVIVGTAGDEYLLLSDGKLRPIEKPKKKKLRHVRILPETCIELNHKLNSGCSVQNAELRRTIADYLENERAQVRQ